MLRRLTIVTRFLQAWAIVFSCTACSHLFFHPEKELIQTPQRQGFEFEDLQTLSADGTPIHGWVLLPKAAATSSLGRATVVHLHGNAENISTHFQFVAWLTTFNHRVITFDYRGYGKSAGVPERKGSIEDTCAVLAWTKLNFPQEPIVVLGQSLGGAIAVSAATTCATKIDGLVLDSTFDSYRRVAREKIGEIWLTWLLQYPLSYLVSDADSPIDSAHKIRVPLIMFHRPSDPIVPFHLGVDLFAELGSKEKQFYAMPGSGHLATFYLVKSPERKQLLDFLEHRIVKRI